MSSSIPSALVWEDGLRTNPEAKSFEWWYFDSQLTDGSSVVVTFYTKSPSESAKPPKPFVEITRTTKNGEKHYFSQEYAYTDFSAAVERCDVTIGPNTFAGDLKKYRIHISLPDVVADIELTAVAPAFHTAHADNKPEHFGWFPAVPFGKVRLKMRYEGFEGHLEGTGYHDHNWGDLDIKDVCDYWYWGRGNAGEYSVIFSLMVLPKILGGAHASVMYLAKGEKILIESSNQLRLTETDISPERPQPGHLPTKLTFELQDGDYTVALNLRKPQLIEQKNPRAGETGLKKILTQLFAHPLYVRYTCELALSVAKGDRHDQKNGHAIYEIMMLH